MLNAWATFAQDLAVPATQWLRVGAPAGIAVPFELDGILESVGPEFPASIDDLPTDPVNNYTGVEDDPEALKIIQQYIANGWLRAFDSLEVLTAYVGGPPVFGKFACIDKNRADGSKERRTINDTKVSGVTDCTRRHYRAVLPRQTDLVGDTSPYRRTHARLSQ